MNKISAAICCINSKYIHSSLAPWCLLAGVKEYCNENISAKVIEGTINENKSAIISRIFENQYDVISFCCYIWNISYVLDIAKEIKQKLPRSLILLGGPEVSYCQQKVLDENSFVDYILSGEGEKSYPQFLNTISINDDVSKIDGLSYRKDNLCHVSQSVVLDDDPVSPYTKEYFDNLNGRIAYIETSRGCPYSCAFCLSGRCGKARFFDIKKAKQNIILLANSGTKTIKFVDRTFNANKKRATEIINFIVEKYHSKEIPNDVCFHFEIAGDILDEKIISSLTNAPYGLFQLEIGLQSFNSKTLQSINRKTNIQKLKQNIIALQKNQNMHIHIDLIAGLPFENLNSFKDSFNTAFELKSNMLQLGFLKLLYGAPMRENSEEFPCEYSTPPPYEVISTPWLNKDEIIQLKGVEDVLDRTYNSGRFLQTLCYVLSASQKSAFDVFDELAKNLSNYETKNISLDEYTSLIYQFFSEQDYINKDILRDKMVCDRLATNASGKIPKILQIQDKNLKKYKNALKIAYPVPDGTTKRGVAILYSQNKVVFADYHKEHNIQTIFKLNFVDTKALNIDK